MNKAALFIENSSVIDLSLYYPVSLSNFLKFFRVKSDIIFSDFLLMGLILLPDIGDSFYLINLPGL